MTVSGGNPCGAVTVNYGDGDVVTYAIDSLPITNYHMWTSGGTKTITATGQGNCSGSAQKSVTLNTPPSVSLTSPAANDTFISPATVTLTASASDSDGSIASVAFYSGGTLLTTDTSAPYSYTWSGVSNGIYGLTAVATDNQGAVTSSNVVSITVGDPTPSTVTGVSVSPSTAAVNTTVTVTVVGGNPCGAVQINFGDGDAPYLPIEGLPYQRTHNYASEGTYTVTATGMGNCYGQASTTITITGTSSTTGATGLPAEASAKAGATGPRNELTRVNYSVSKFSLRSVAPASAMSFLESDEALPTADEAIVPAPPPTPVAVLVDILAGASGTVTSAPSGFNCTGQDVSCTAQFEANATVTMTATPASGQTFLGWGGACSGTATCVVLASSALLVTAAFSTPGSATTTYYHTDILGSVRAITNASGAIDTRLDYAPFGESNASLTGDPKKFLGQERDAETAFDYLGARYYRNVWGRFSSPDPIFSTGAVRNPQLWNRYSYGLNSPLTFSDPSGMEAVEDGPDTRTDMPVFEGDFLDPVELSQQLSFSTLFPVWNPSQVAQLGQELTSTLTCQEIAAGKLPAIGIRSFLLGLAWDDVMFHLWLAGIGNPQVVLGPASIQSQQLLSTPALAAKIKDFLTTGNGTGRVEFTTPRAVLSAGANPTAQFVGSYRYSMKLRSGFLDITLTNTTTKWSGAYHASGLNPREPIREGWTPMGTIMQTYQITVPCRR